MATYHVHCLDVKTVHSRWKRNQCVCPLEFLICLISWLLFVFMCTDLIKLNSQSEYTPTYGHQCQSCSWWIAKSQLCPQTAGKHGDFVIPNEDRWLIMGLVFNYFLLPSCNMTVAGVVERFYCGAKMDATIETHWCTKPKWTPGLSTSEANGFIFVFQGELQ